MRVQPVLSGHPKRRPQVGFQDLIALNAGQKYYRMLSWLPFVFKTFVLSIFEWPLKTGFWNYLSTFRDRTIRSL